MKWILILFCLMSASANALTLTQNFNFDGYLLDNSNNPIVGPVVLDLQIYNPSENCLLYEETQTSVPVDSTTGLVSIKVGAGTRAGSDPGLAWTRVFTNGTSFSTSTGCPSGYTPATGDGRHLQVKVNSTLLSPMYSISAAPMATVADSLQGGSTIDGSVTLGHQGALMLQDTSGANTVSIKAPTSLGTSTSYIMPNADGGAGSFLSTNGSGNLSWTMPTPGITSLNGVTSISQAFTTIGTTGTGPNWVSTSPNHTLNIPLASVASVTAGLISNSDYNMFVNKQPTIGFVPVNKAGDASVGSLAMSGTLTLAADPVASMQASTKNYVDTAVASANSAATAANALATAALPKSGGTMSGPVLFSIAGTPSSPALQFPGGGVGLFSPAANTIGFAGSGIEVMRVTPGGVGIGTGSPMAMLDVMGPVKVGTLPAAVPMTQVMFFPSKSCTITSLGIGSQISCTVLLAGAGLVGSDFVSLNCQPYNPPPASTHISVSCNLTNTANQIEIVVGNLTTSSASYTQTLWNIAVTKFN